MVQIIACTLLFLEAIIGFCLMDEGFRTGCIALWGNAIRVVEQQLVLAAICILSGVVGLVFFTPILAVCGILFGVGLHRSGVLNGVTLKVQVPVYTAVLVGMGIMSVWLGQRLKDAVHVPTASEIGDYIVHQLGTSNNNGEHSQLPLPQPSGLSPLKPPMLRPFEVSVKCMQVTLPVHIPVGETLRLVPLIHPWPPHVAMPHLIYNGDSSPQQWPSSALLARSRDINDQLAIDCKIDDHGKADVLDLAIPFEYVFYGSNKPLDLGNKQILEVDLNPVNVGAPVHIYFVDDCSDPVGLVVPQKGKGRLVGDKKIRDVQFELEPGTKGWALHGASFIGGWGQMSCS